MQFHYIASQPDGKIVENQIEAKDVAEVLNSLTVQGLRPVSIKPVGSKRGGHQLFGGRITLGDQVFLSKYLGLMLRIGTSLLQAIQILIEDISKPTMKMFLIEIRSNLERGLPFYTTFARHEKVFGRVYVNLVKSGETAGNLEKIFEDLTVSLTKQKTLRDQIQGALVYPLLLLGTSVLILVFLITFALPKISKVFSEGGFDPPLFSKVVFAVGGFLGKFGIFFVLIGIIGLAFLIYGYRTLLVVRKLIWSLVNEIPIIKEIVRKITIQRFAATLSSLIRAGMPLTEALKITANTVSQAEAQEALVRIADEGLAKGLTVGEAFKRETFFPQTVVNLIAISEKAGHIEEVLQTLADFYAGEIDSSLKTLVAFVEPIMLLFIGGIIGLIALAIILPIYQLTTQF